MTLTQTRLARINGKVCIVTNEQPRNLLRYVPLCERGRVCSGINCPCHATKHLGVAPSTE